MMFFAFSSITLWVRAEPTFRRFFPPVVVHLGPGGYEAHGLVVDEGFEIVKVCMSLRPAAAVAEVYLRLWEEIDEIFFVELHHRYNRARGMIIDEVNLDDLPPMLYYSESGEHLPTAYGPPPSAQEVADLD